MKRMILALGTVLTFGLAAAQDDALPTFGTSDLDASGELTMEEFGTGIGSQAYEDFDADVSGTIDREEFGQGVFNLFDRDRDAMLTQEELDRGTQAFFGDEFTGGAYEEIDADTSGGVTEAEFASGFTLDTAYDDFDADANEEIEQEEFNQGLFDVVDVEDDDRITQQEFADSGMLFADDGDDASDDTVEGQEVDDEDEDDDN